MIQEGITDYKDGMTYSQLFMKYMDYGATLEKNSDKKFNAVLKNMQKELKDNNYDLSIIDDITIYYNSSKTATKNALINRGIAYLE